jgi:hypothetical protein
MVNAFSVNQEDRLTVVDPGTLDKGLFDAGRADLLGRAGERVAVQDDERAPAK